MHLCSFGTELDTVKLEKEAAWECFTHGNGIPGYFYNHTLNEMRSDLEVGAKVGGRTMLTV